MIGFSLGVLIIFGSVALFGNNSVKYFFIETCFIIIYLTSELIEIKKNGVPKTLCMTVALLIQLKLMALKITIWGVNSLFLLIVYGPKLK